ncbi:peptidoglycan-associated lipoprotein Pal [Roseovarius sp. SCSIO 43702]|uniref:peptidoglycan-associated lipoprotein Pal n=1 Tax=Roseovarius sp. SCSIO 43702 TaxID=2823043 RepID=UPI001C73AC03|nr:peptidoglycan-associated lipoprotein Pal [Roseovarius sp. SCSIO 43702]QYX58490.1 peptidoglycan-associated lipoprotein Pal [Roseovarius sp. SCSIO 43702]
MTYLNKALLVGAALALAACTSPDRFDGDSAVDLNNSGMAGAGSASDPSSPAYFQQAIGDRVLFPVDQHTLTSEAQRTLDGQAQWLLTNSDYDALIEGHADEQGTREYNLALGARRANSVHEYLVSKGIAANRLKVVSYGKERPIEICSTESCYAKNRRAVTVISIGAGV